MTEIIVDDLRRFLYGFIIVLMCFDRWLILMSLNKKYNHSLVISQLNREFFNHLSS